MSTPRWRPGQTLYGADLQACIDADYPRVPIDTDEPPAPGTTRRFRHTLDGTHVVEVQPETP